MSEQPRLTRGDMDADLDREIWRIPAHCREGLVQYLRYGYAPGHFLLALLSNDLAEACGRADDENQVAIFQYVYVLTNYAPAAAWGSPEKVRAWIQRGVDLRSQVHEEATK